MKRTFSIIGIVIGICIVILGLYFATGFQGDFGGSHTQSCAFGADYYTEQYTATQNAANNILSLGSYLEDAISWCVRMFGLFISTFGGVVICYFGSKLETKSTPTVSGEKQDNQVPPLMSDESAMTANEQATSSETEGL